MKIPVVRSHPRIPMLATAHLGDAGADLSASENHTIEPGQTVLVGTGLSMAIPPGYAGFVLPRSGLAINHGITVANAPGLIDSGYRGEIRVGLINHSNSAFAIEVGDRIAQLVVMSVETPEFVEVEELDRTDRGVGGFGSTGVAGA
ncbi:MAG: dUTP diphosphatase [Acidimicrobiia bacterium]|nr:dUTP diphosphatase [Acidimicrobiia bacterium]